ncbi:hypothetical protein MNBD_ALPHA11-175 [hydrothermal vent metagenome]|uniref:Uncharacterized protein n=1 Tax=hydrothermal vent metagenome TaxID=652676 RepID=A0A3B0TL60_9ZZZZ
MYISSVKLTGVIERIVFHRCLQLACMVHFLSQRDELPPKVNIEMTLNIKNTTKPTKPN